jgi:hypothetical protein
MKKMHWNKNDEKLLSFGRIPNQPEMSTKIFTQPMAHPSKNIRAKTLRGLLQS